METANRLAAPSSRDHAQRHLTDALLHYDSVGENGVGFQT